jgi:hypothetical protein
LVTDTKIYEIFTPWIQFFYLYWYQDSNNFLPLFKSYNFDKQILKRYNKDKKIGFKG